MLPTGVPPSPPYRSTSGRLPSPQAWRSPVHQRHGLGSAAARPGRVLRREHREQDAARRLARALLIISSSAVLIRAMAALNMPVDAAPQQVVRAVKEQHDLRVVDVQLPREPGHSRRVRRLARLAAIARQSRSGRCSGPTAGPAACSGYDSVTLSTIVTGSGEVVPCGNAVTEGQETDGRQHGNGRDDDRESARPRPATAVSGRAGDSGRSQRKRGVRCGRARCRHGCRPARRDGGVEHDDGELSLAR